MIGKSDNQNQRNFFQPLLNQKCTDKDKFSAFINLLRLA
jgi:hypothetical protein